MVDFEISNLIARVQFPLSAPGQEDKQINGPAVSKKPTCAVAITLISQCQYNKIMIKFINQCDSDYWHY